MKTERVFLSEVFDALGEVQEQMDEFSQHDNRHAIGRVRDRIWERYRALLNEESDGDA